MGAPHAAAALGSLADIFQLQSLHINGLDYPSLK